MFAVHLADPKSITIADGRKYAALTPEYESENIPGLFFIGTLGHVLDWRKSSGGFLHGLRYTARAAFKILESKNLGLPWPSTTVPMPGGEVDALQQKLTDRMDSSSGLYQMFAFLADAVILPERGSDGAAEYLEEVPLAMISDMAKGREYLTLTMEYGPDFHGHERVFARSRVFHRAPPSTHARPTGCVLRFCSLALAPPHGRPGARAPQATIRPRATSRSSCTRCCATSCLAPRTR